MCGIYLNVITSQVLVKVTKLQSPQWQVQLQYQYQFIGYLGCLQDQIMSVDTASERLHLFKNVEEFIGLVLKATTYSYQQGLYEYCMSIPYL